MIRWLSRTLLGVLLVVALLSTWGGCGRDRRYRVCDDGRSSYASYAGGYRGRSFDDRSHGHDSRRYHDRDRHRGRHRDRDRDCDD